MAGSGMATKLSVEIYINAVKLILDIVYAKHHSFVLQEQLINITVTTAVPFAFSL